MNENALAAGEEYVGQRVVVSGEYSEVDEGGVSIRRDKEPSFYVDCHYRDDTDKNPLSKLRNEDVLVLQGEISVIQRIWVVTVHLALEDCTILSVETPEPAPTRTADDFTQPTPTEAPQPTSTPPSTSLLSSLVTIDVFQGGCRQTSGLNHEGGGWVYEDGWVITALHTLRWDGSLFNLGGSDASPVISEVHVNNGDSDYTCGKVVGTDSLRDLAAIKLIDSVSLIPLPTGATPAVDAPVTLLVREGYNGWQEPEVTRIEGRVAGLHQGNGTAYMTAWGAGVSGDSGSPLVDGQGRVIGMVQAGQIAQESPDSPIASNLAGIMPIEEISRVWERLKAGEHLHIDSQPWFDTESWQGGTP